nr:carboxypeptidase-like regulatory domain-containing protein [Bacteroidales bacterium]
MKKMILLAYLIFQTLFFIQAQVVRVSGKVTDSGGEPLPGVNIVEKGTTNGTISDMDGVYSLSVSGSSSILVFSYIGFQGKEVVVGTSTTINVQLTEKTVGLDEVVITALGITQAKKAVGYSVQDFSGEELSRVNALNVANLFTGQVSGLTVNNPTGIFQSPTLVLRGKTPLIVIDDIPVSTNFFDLTASDIDNVTVLKGTTASALYGSRGRNGAILISTKKAGKEGLEIILSNNTMITAGFTVWPKTQTQYGNGSNGQYEFWDGQDGG